MEQNQFTRHGGAYDRGSADAYYARPYSPHYYIGDSYTSERVGVQHMTDAEIFAYNKGYSETPFGAKY